MSHKSFFPSGSSDEEFEDVKPLNIYTPYEVGMDHSEKRTSEASSEDEFEEVKPLNMYCPLEDEVDRSRKRPLEDDYQPPSKRINFKEEESDSDDASPRSANTMRSFSFFSSSQESTDSVPQVKREATNGSKHNLYDEKAMRMMQRMGYKEGSGLGKFEQGRRDIVEMSQQRGRRGLGLHIKGLEPAEVEWDSSLEQISVEEKVYWIPSAENKPVPDKETLKSWVLEGKKKLTIDDETQYCDPSILSKILSCKSVFDELEPTEMRRAVARANPFESIKGGIFQNRAAMKMANLDTVFDFMFTDPKDEYGNSLVEPSGLLYFADVCAGPGGFSEYVLWKKRWEAKGFGFTLRGSNDFKLEEFFAGSPETFEPLYGKDGTGNIFLPENLRSFQNYVLAHTENKGVHFMMADGGFSVEGQENIQEILSKQLYICQFLCALLIVRAGGNFVCKLFDIFTPFSVGLVYLMYRAFKLVSIHKPNTSRPANSERYIICKWKREDTQPIADYFFDINGKLNFLLSPASEDDILQVVDPEVIREDLAFYDYILESNNRLGARQVVHLAKVQAFARNTKLIEERQDTLKRKCLFYWQVPDKVRSAPPKADPDVKFSQLVKDPSSVPLSSEPIKLTPGHLPSIHGIYDYYCVVVADNVGAPQSHSQPLFVLGLGKTHVFTRTSRQQRWIKLELKVELPPGTLLYAEVVPELKGEGKAQKRNTSLHIMDALFLGEKDVRALPYYERMAQAARLAKAVSKPSNRELALLRVKELFPLRDLENILNRLAMKQVKNSNQPLRLCYNLDNSLHFFPGGVMMFKAVLDPYMIGYSRSRNKYYYYNTRTKASTFQPAPGVVATFSESFLSRLLWQWEQGVLDNSVSGDNKVDKVTMLNLVERLKANMK